jgi:hypothetical protein
MPNRNMGTEKWEYGRKCWNLAVYCPTGTGRFYFCELLCPNYSSARHHSGKVGYTSDMSESDRYQYAS